jgi:hypothetical protein
VVQVRKIARRCDFARRTRLAVAPVNSYGPGTVRAGIRETPQGEVLGRPLFGGLIIGRGHDRRRVGNVHLEGASADAASVVGNLDGDRVDAVVGVGVVKPERLGGGVQCQWLLTATVTVIDRRRPARPARVSERTGACEVRAFGAVPVRAGIDDWLTGAD